MAEKKTGTQLTFKDTLTSALESQKQYLPEGLNIQRFTHNAMYAMTHNDTLVKYVQQYGANGQIQVRDALLKAAYLGLDCGLSTDYYLYNYGSTLTFSLSPIGTAKMIRKYSAKPVAKGPYTELVYQGESFQRKYLDDGTPWFDRTFLSEDERVGKEIKGAVSWVIFSDGDRRYEYMSIDQLNTCRKQSKMANGSVWNNYPDRMYLKTVLHRLYRSLDVEFDSPIQKDTFVDDMAIETDDKNLRDMAVNESANSVDFEDFIEAEVKPVEESGDADAT